MDPQKNFNPAASNDGQQMSPPATVTPQVNTSYDAGVTVPITQPVSTGHTPVASTVGDVSVSSSEPTNGVDNIQQGVPGGNVGVAPAAAVFPAPSPANEAGVVGAASQPSIAGEEYTAGATAPVSTAPGFGSNASVTAPPAANFGTPTNPTAGSQLFASDQPPTGLPGVAPIAASHSGEKKTIIILSTVALVLIIAIAVLYFI